MNLLTSKKKTTKNPFGIWLLLWCQIITKSYSKNTKKHFHKEVFLWRDFTIMNIRISHKSGIFFVWLRILGQYFLFLGRMRRKIFKTTSHKSIIICITIAYNFKKYKKTPIIGVYSALFITVFTIFLIFGLLGSFAETYTARPFSRTIDAVPAGGFAGIVLYT